MIIVIIKATPDIKRAAFILDSKLWGGAYPTWSPRGCRSWLHGKQKWLELSTIWPVETCYYPILPMQRNFSNVKLLNNSVNPINYVIQTDMLQRLVMEFNNPLRCRRIYNCIKILIWQSPSSVWFRVSMSWLVPNMKFCPQWGKSYPVI